MKRVRLKAFLADAWRDDQGTTSIEYALIAVLVSVAIIGALSMLGTEVSAMFSMVANALTS